MYEIVARDMEWKVPILSQKQASTILVAAVVVVVVVVFAPLSLLPPSLKQEKIKYMWQICTYVCMY